MRGWSFMGTRAWTWPRSVSVAYWSRSRSRHQRWQLSVSVRRRQTRSVTPPSRIDVGSFDATLCRAAPISRNSHPPDDDPVLLSSAGTPQDPLGKELEGRVPKRQVICAGRYLSPPEDGGPLSATCWASRFWRRPCLLRHTMRCGGEPWRYRTNCWTLQGRMGDYDDGRQRGVDSTLAGRGKCG